MNRKRDSTRFANADVSIYNAYGQKEKEKKCSYSCLKKKIGGYRIRHSEILYLDSGLLKEKMLMKDRLLLPKLYQYI